jgi:hypothetical protein
MISNDSPSASLGVTDPARLSFSLDRENSVIAANLHLVEHIGVGAGRDIPGLQIGRPT